MAINPRTKQAAAIGAGTAAGTVLGVVVADRISGGSKVAGLPTVATTAAPAQGTGSSKNSPALPVSGPLPSSVQGAPTVGDLKATYSNGTAVVTWTGTQVSSWKTSQGVASNTGYALYISRANRWLLLKTDVYPPQPINNVAPGTTLGVAPTYVLSDGTEIGGGIQKVTVGG